jgi:hypothetical protein
MKKLFMIVALALTLSNVSLGIAYACSCTGAGGGGCTGTADCWQDADGRCHCSDVKQLDLE